MSDLAIRVDSLSKVYRIGLARRRHDTLRDQLASSARQLLRRDSGRRRDEDIIWALRDVSFEVHQGEVVGLIGRNGAGKTTLLKILSRITQPTDGRAEIYGRVASLLEVVGAGFHPELTGRENIYLNGAILGMSKADIERKFDEIVAFADIERFIYTPVKRYSSGMYMRLGFAVAAHLEPEILMVDEVLAVGDAEFQEKCLGKIGDVAREGRTVLFVSHNMPSVQHLCNRVMLLQSGRIQATGRPSEVISLYLSEAREQSQVSIAEWHDRVTTGQARIVQFEIGTGDRQVTNSIPVGGSVRFSIVGEFSEPIVDPCFGVVVHDATGEPILDLRSIHDGLRLGRVTGNMVVSATVENLGLYPGDYLLSPWITDAACAICIDWVKFCSKLHVYPAPGGHGDLKLDPTYGRYWIPSIWSKT